MADPAQEGDAVKERGWTCFRFESGATEWEGIGPPFGERVEVVDRSLLTQALEAMEKHASRASSSNQQLGREAALIRSQLQTDS